MPAAAPEPPAPAAGTDPGTPVAPPPQLTDALGGPWGFAESALPAAAFVTAYTAGGQDTTLAVVVAVAVGVLLSLARLLRGGTLLYAISGLAGIALAAFVVSRTGNAEDFFLPGLLMNLGYAAAYAISILVRWPLLGVVANVATGQGSQWRKDPAEVRAYSRASWVWVGLFAGRLAVQLPLYLAGEVVVLGVARVAMGIPLFAVALWLSYLMLRGRVAALGRPAAPSPG